MRVAAARAALFVPRFPDPDAASELEPATAAVIARTDCWCCCARLLAQLEEVLKRLKKSCELSVK